MPVREGNNKFGAFLLAGSFQQLQVVGESVEGNAEQEVELLRRRVLLPDPLLPVSLDVAAEAAGEGPEGLVEEIGDGGVEEAVELALLFGASRVGDVDREVELGYGTAGSGEESLQGAVGRHGRVGGELQMWWLERAGRIIAEREL